MRAGAGAACAAQEIVLGSGRACGKPGHGSVGCAGVRSFSHARLSKSVRASLLVFVLKELIEVQRDALVFAVDLLRIFAAEF